MYGISVPVFQKTPIRLYLVTPPKHESVTFTTVTKQISEFVKDVEVRVDYT